LGGLKNENASALPGNALLMKKWRRRGVVFAVLGVIVLLSWKTTTEYVGRRVAADVCTWVNEPGSSKSLEVPMGAETRNHLSRLRVAGVPVTCAQESSPYAESFWNETAVVVRPANGPHIGLRVGLDFNGVKILGYWTPR
jgi:predicted metal-binding membrane protein